MKFSLALEAVEKATKTVLAISKAMKSLNTKSIREAEKAAFAYEKSAITLNKNAMVAEKAAVAAQKAIKAEQALSNAAQKTLQVSSARYQIETGVTNIGRGATSVGKYGALVGRGASAAGSIAFSAGASGVQDASKYQMLMLSMRGVTKSAEEAKLAMEWIEKAQMPPYGLEDLTKGYIELKNIGIDPAKGALQNIADMGAGTGRGIDQAAKAYTSAIKGNLQTLELFGITARKNGKYVEYMFAGKDGHLKKYKAVAGDRSANANAIDNVVSARFGGASAAYGKTWDGMMGRLTGAWENANLKIMNSGVFDFMAQKLELVVSLVDRWGQDGTIDRWCQTISTDLIAIMTVTWGVVEKLVVAGQAIFAVLDTISGYVGGWENLALILLALPVVPGLMRMAVGFAQVGRGIATFIGIMGKGIALFAQLNGFSKIVGGLKSLIAPIGLVTKSFITMGVTGLRSLIVSIGLATKSFIIMGVTGLRSLIVSIGLATKSIITMGIAFMTTPIGWVVAGIAAIAGGAYLIYRNWDKIGPYFKNIWSKTKQIFNAFWSSVKGIFSWNNIFTAINWFSYLMPIRWVEFIPGFPGWETVMSWLTWDNFLSVLNWATYLPQWLWNDFLAIINWLDFIPAFPGWAKIIQSETVQGVWDEIVGFFEAAKGKIQAVFDTISGAWNFVKGLFSKGTKEAAVNIIAQDPQAIAAATAEVDKLSKKLDALSATDFSDVNAALTGLQDKTAEAIAKAGGIEQAFNVAIEGGELILKTTNFESYGIALMRTFAEGIRNGAGAAIAAMQEVVGQIGDFLPHSPATFGSLSNLNRVSLSSSIYGPRPLTLGLATGRNNADNTVSLKFAPVINVSGNADRQMMRDVMQQVMDELRTSLPNMLDKVAAAKKRREY